MKLKTDSIPLAEVNDWLAERQAECEKGQRLNIRVDPKRHSVKSRRVSFEWAILGKLVKPDFFEFGQLCPPKEASARLASEKARAGKGFRTFEVELGTHGVLILWCTP